LLVTWTLAPSPAQAELRIYGDPTVQQQVNDALADIESTPEGQALVDALRSSERVTTISTIAPNAFGICEGGCSRADNRTRPQGARVYWDPTYTGELEPGVSADPSASLLHELAHAVQYVTSDRSLKRSDRETGIRESEIQATARENVYRMRKGLPARTTYGGRTLPEDRCGNGVVDSAAEQCDGGASRLVSCRRLGYATGRLGCDAECFYDLSACSHAICGNGVQEHPEQCDGIDLGGDVCSTVGFEAGVLGCTRTCTFDTGGCCRSQFDVTGAWSGTVSFGGGVGPWTSIQLHSATTVTGSITVRICADLLRPCSAATDCLRFCTDSGATCFGNGDCANLSCQHQSCTPFTLALNGTDVCDQVDLSAGGLASLRGTVNGACASGTLVSPFVAGTWSGCK
jgi:hypothetical protein